LLGLALDYGVKYSALDARHLSRNTRVILAMAAAELNWSRATSVARLMK
jgi:hypothetical protein